MLAKDFEVPNQIKESYIRAVRDDEEFFFALHVKLLNVSPAYSLTMRPVPHVDAISNLKKFTEAKLFSNKKGRLDKKTPSSSYRFGVIYSGVDEQIGNDWEACFLETLSLFDPLHTEDLAQHLLDHFLHSEPQSISDLTSSHSASQATHSETPTMKGIVHGWS
jgi:hypothetical protein